jgi:hypothetical protein
MTHMTHMTHMTIYTLVVITPSPTGFGLWCRGELSISPRESRADLSDLVSEGHLTPLDDALDDEWYQAAGLRDIRGLIHDQPSHIFVRGHDTPAGPQVHYYGVDESEAGDDFFSTP